MSGDTDGIELTVAWFETAILTGQPAYGDPETLSWGDFASIFSWRREGEKDGPAVAASRFRLEPDGRQVRRKLDRVLGRSAVALDIEGNAKTGKVPPPVGDAVQRLQATGLAGLVYSSHSHHPEVPRYRIILPLEQEIAADIPAPLFLAQRLDLLGVVDRGKVNAASLFYLPSCPYGALDQHETHVVAGVPVEKAWLDLVAAERQAALDRVAAAAAQAAADRRAERIAAGFGPGDSLIEKIRSRFDLAGVLQSHGYDENGGRYRHPASQSGCFGASIKAFGGIDRVYSHNAGDPLHHSNLPAWASVRAVDAFDAVVVLDFGGDRERALRELAERFDLSKAAARKAVAAVIHRKIRQRASQEEIEGAAYTAGYLNGLTRDEVVAVAKWVAEAA